MDVFCAVMDQHSSAGGYTRANCWMRMVVALNRGTEAYVQLRKIQAQDEGWSVDEEGVVVVVNENAGGVC